MVSLSARAASGAAWTYASFATGRVLVFAGLAIVARLLGPEEYGLFAMAAVGIYFLEGSYDFGLTRALIYLGGEHPPGSLIRTGFVLAVGLGGAISSLLFGLAPSIAAFYGDPRVTDLMHALSVYFLIACVGLVPDAILQRQLAFDRRFWPSLAAPAGRYAIAIVLAAHGYGAWSLVWGQLVGISLEVVCLSALARWKPGIGWSTGVARRLISFSSQVSVVEWVAAFALNLDYVLVGHFLGGPLLGLYALAFKLPDTTLGAAGFVGSRVLLPTFVSLERPRLGIALVEALRLLMMVLVPAGVGLFVLAPVIVPLVFGDQWTEAVPVVQLLALSSCLNGLLQAVGAGFLAVGQPRRIIAAQVAWLLLLVPALYVTAQISIVAVAAAHMLSMLVFGGVKLTFARSSLGVGGLQLGRAAAPSLLATGAMVLALVPMLRLAAPLPPLAVATIGTVLGAATYATALWILDPGALQQILVLVMPDHPRHTQRGHASAMSRPLTVTMFVQSYFPRVGGAETNLQSLVGPLRARGVEVAVLTRRFPDMASEDCVAGAPVFRLPVPGGQWRASLTFTIAAVWLLIRQRWKVDVLHAHELRSPTLTAVVAKLVLRRPVVAHVLRGGLLGDIPVLKAVPLGGVRLWLFKQLVDTFVAISEETRRELLGAGIPEERITSVAYGVDVDRFRPAPPAERERCRKELCLENWRVVLVVARLEPEKGLDTLLAAWPCVKSAEPRALLVIAGDGSQRAALTNQAATLHDVRFLGLVRDPVPYLQTADCYTLPSLTEGLPLSLLEAMAAGVPCVVTAIGGSSEALAGLGELVLPGDPERLAEAIVKVLRFDAADRESAGAATRRRVVDHHSLEANADALSRLYERLARRETPKE
jgi:glycosyltransferase involved in cell wall biosynthesis/O-antigen/teichoic acid export membrane protein